MSMKITYRYIFTRKPGAPAIKVSPEDYERFADKTFHFTSAGYVLRDCKVSKGKYNKLLLHREIMGLCVGDGKVVDHADGDPLNNTRENLRVCTQKENARNARQHCDNRSGYKGIYFHKRNKRWNARIMVDGKTRFLGGYATPDEAHNAYCEAAIKYHGEYSRFN